MISSIYVHDANHFCTTNIHRRQQPASLHAVHPVQKVPGHVQRGQRVHDGPRVRCWGACTARRRPACQTTRGSRLFTLCQARGTGFAKLQCLASRTMADPGIMTMSYRRDLSTRSYAIHFTVGFGVRVDSACRTVLDDHEHEHEYEYDYLLLYV